MISLYLQVDRILETREWDVYATMISNLRNALAEVAALYCEA